MIATATADWRPTDFTGEAAVKIGGLVAAYGLDAPFLRVYAGDGAVFAVMDGDAVLWGDSDEARLFLTMDPTVRRVRTDEHNATALAALWQTEAAVGDVMTPAVPMARSPLAVPLTPREYWEVIAPVFADTLPPFDAWYTDVSHRVRHGVCRLLGIKADGGPVAAAMTTAEDGDRWVIGAVATLPDYRGRGYAAALVMTLAAMGQQSGKSVLLSPKNEGAKRLYEKCGFVVCGRYGQVAR